jgi:hypothetical protein
LIGEDIEVVRGEDDFPDGLLGLFAKLIAASVECCADGSNFLRDMDSICRIKEVFGCSWDELFEVQGDDYFDE